MYKALDQHLGTVRFNGCGTLQCAAIKLRKLHPKLRLKPNTLQAVWDVDSLGFISLVTAII